MSPMRNNIVILIFLLAFAISCSPKKEISDLEIPPGILPLDSMVMIVTDMQIAEATLREFKRLGKDEDQRTEKFYAQVFDKYQLNPEKYKSSIAFYEQHLTAHHQIYTDVITRLTQIQTELNNPLEDQDSISK
jgi:hypothetical protein